MMPYLRDGAQYMLSKQNVDQVTCSCFHCRNSQDIIMISIPPKTVHLHTVATLLR